MPQSVDKTLRKAQRHLKLGQFSEAEELYKQILSQFPKNKKAILHYQELITGTISKASSKSEPTQEQTQHLINLFNQGQFESVLSKLKPLISLFPKAVTLYNIQGASNTAIQKYDAAINSFKKALEIQPKTAEIYNNMATALQNAGDLDTALESYKTAIKIKPDYASAYNNMGFTLMRKRKVDAAINSYKQAIKIKPNYHEAYSNMGISLREIGDLNGSINSYKQAIKIKPDYAAAYNNIGNTLKDQGDLIAAAESFKKALKIRPNYVSAAENLLNTIEFMPSDDNKKEAVTLVDNFLQNFESLLETNGQRQFFQANYLKQNGRINSAFSMFCEANETKFLTHGRSRVAEKVAYSNYLEKVKSWSPKIPPNVQTKLKKIWILGPSRSGKSTLEHILSQSQETKALYESNRILDKDEIYPFIDFKNKLLFDQIFFEKEKSLLSQGYKIVTSTSPLMLNYVMHFANNLPNSYFIFINRDSKNVAPEIFVTQYSAGNSYSYDPHTIIDYLNFYKTAANKLQEKAPKNIISLEFEQIIRNPSSVINHLSEFTSIDFSLKNCVCNYKAIRSDSIFKSHFQKKIKNT